MIVETFQLSFRVFLCAFGPEISSFFSVRASSFYSIFFVLSAGLLRYIPFHVVSNDIVAYIIVQDQDGRNFNISYLDN